MERIALEKVPQQSFDITLEGVRWTLAFRTPSNAEIDCALVSISKDGKSVLEGILCAPNALLMPYEKEGGNFFFYCNEGEYPSWKNFEETCILYYLTSEEMDELRG